ncbi:MAG: ATP-binding protein [Methanomassiliicoccaceae archaeon]|nr:ATP-binding protein [Methanomassiliicoccaceae archaeon]
MAEFIGRRKELDLLEGWYAGDGFEFVAMYGRRRVGKTALIEQFIKGKPAIFFSARRTKGNSNMRLFNKAVKRPLGVDDDNVLYFDDLLGMVADKADGRLVLVIDEFPYFAESNDDILSALQVFIDHTAKRTKLFLILCGSSMGFMKRQVLGYESPLYGRRTQEMHVAPMGYMESAEFLKGRSSYEKACIYGAVGGVPMYLSRFSGEERAFDLLAREFFSRDSLLPSEPESLILQELLDPKGYSDIIEAMANGSTRISDMAGRSGIAAAEVSRRLDDLIGLAYVEKVSPMNERSERRTRYHLSDNLFRFCYQMVAARKQTMPGTSLEGTSENLELEFPEYMGRVFESMCRQYVAERMGYPVTGKWWGPTEKGATAEIDVIGSVGRRGRTEGLFAECKFTSRLADMADLEKLKGSAAFVKGFDVRRYAVFSRSGFTDRLADRAEAEGVELISLDMMYGDAGGADGGA